MTTPSFLQWRSTFFNIFALNANNNYVAIKKDTKENSRNFQTHVFVMDLSWNKTKYSSFPANVNVKILYVMQSGYKHNYHLLAGAWWDIFSHLLSQRLGWAIWRPWSTPADFIDHVTQIGQTFPIQVLILSTHPVLGHHCPTQQFFVQNSWRDPSVISDHILPLVAVPSPVVHFPV